MSGRERAYCVNPNRFTFSYVYFSKYTIRFELILMNHRANRIMQGIILKNVIQKFSIIINWYKSCKYCDSSLVMLCWFPDNSFSIVMFIFQFFLKNFIMWEFKSTFFCRLLNFLFALAILRFSKGFKIRGKYN